MDIKLEFSTGKKTATTSVAADVAPVSVGTVSIQKDLQKTQPSIPLANAFPRAELGDSGTRLIHGIITEEYNPQLQGIQGIRVFEEMRKSDGTVRAAMLVCTLPIRRANWFVKEASDDPQDLKIAEFVRHALFDWIEDMTWDDFMRESLLSLPFGVMLFEKVYGTYEHEGTTFVTLTKLAPRLPKSIMQWELVDGTFGIQQIRQDGVLAQIPGSKLLIFVNEREGDNWWGTSMIRPAYQHWYRKQKYYAIDSMAFERQGLGVPTITMPQGYTPDDEKRAATALKNLRADAKQYMILPPGYEFKFADMGGKTVRDPTLAVEHHNKQILQSVLAQFLELGATKSGSGSRALSQDHSDLFLKSMEAVANTQRDAINRQLIKELVDLNFNDVKTYPVLNYEGITKTDIQAFGTAYAQLVTAGAITPTDSDQQMVRALMGLPERTEEEIEEADDNDPSSEELEDEVQGDGNDPDANEEEVDPAAAKTAKPAQTKKDNAKTDKATAKPKPGKPAPKKPATASERVRRFSATSFKSWRPMTFAEQGVNFTKLQDNMNALEASFSADATKLLNDAKDSFMSKLHTALEAGDYKTIATLEMNFESDYKALLKKTIQEAYVQGKNHASNEIGIDPPPNVADTLRNIDVMATAIAKKTATDLETKAKISTANALKGDKTPLESAGAIDANLQDAIDTSVQNAADLLIGQGINMGRNDVFDRNGADIYALQRSELLDKKTCNFCISMDGRVVPVGDEWASTDIFHSNCRGIWVAILKDEVNPPPIDGVPSNVGDLYGGEPNSLVQPKTPIPKPGSLAEKFVKEQAAKKAK